jgi:hypothetical protein
MLCKIEFSNITYLMILSTVRGVPIDDVLNNCIY